MITSQHKVRQLFFIENPQLSQKKTNGTFSQDIVHEFNLFVDYLERSGTISMTLAARVSLG